jgi:uncharacterized protein with von Willebrand factor type A (vWA) domain
MPSGYYNTDLGSSLEDFVDHYMDSLNGGTTLILVGDGRDYFSDPRLDLFGQIARRSTRTIWLNPEPPSLWGTGNSDMQRYAPLCSRVLQVSNLSELATAVDNLLSL